MGDVAKVGMATPRPSFRPFCDGCGTRFEEGQLRACSKFCSFCGVELSPWIKKTLTGSSITPATTSVTPTVDHRQTSQQQMDKQSEEDDAASEGGEDRMVVQQSTGWRETEQSPGKERGRVRGRGRGGGFFTPITQDEQENVRRLRGSSRPDNSLTHYFSNLLDGKSVDHEAQSNEVGDYTLYFSD
jgi:hypothetical protein